MNIGDGKMTNLANATKRKPPGVGSTPKIHQRVKANLKSGKAAIKFSPQTECINLRPSVYESSAYRLENSLKTNIKCQILNLFFIHYYFLE
ncbi:hypothetical protein T08_538 [Trichinella sp. T8]|nr:hypothetical protein T08_538 [Trichinella sp. T8]